MAVQYPELKLPKQPVTRSKMPLSAFEDLIEKVGPNEPSTTKQDIEYAFAAASRSLADNVVILLRQSDDMNAKLGELKTDSSFFEEFSTETLKKWREIQPGQNPSEDETVAKAHIMSIWEHAIDPVLSNYRDIAEEQNKNPKYTAAIARRDAINELLRVLKNNGTHYELLGLAHAASISQVNQAYRKKALMIHPDRNKDEEAQSCFQGKHIPFASSASTNTLSLGNRDRSSPRPYQKGGLRQKTERRSDS